MLSEYAAGMAVRMPRVRRCGRIAMRPYGYVADTNGGKFGAACGGYERRDDWRGVWSECAAVRVGTFRETFAGARERVKWSTSTVWDARWGWRVLSEYAAGMSVRMPRVRRCGRIAMRPYRYVDVVQT